MTRNFAVLSDLIAASALCIPAAWLVAFVDFLALAMNVVLMAFEVSFASKYLVAAVNFAGP